MIDKQRLATMKRILPRVGKPTSHPCVDLVPGHLSVSLFLEGEAGTRDITQDDLNRWDTTIDELMPLAVENLRHRSTHDGWLPVETAPGMCVYMSRDGEAASRMLLLTELLQPLALGGVLVAVPGRDQLLAVPLHELDGLETMRILASTAAYASDDNPESLSDQLFWWDGDNWHLLAVQRDDQEIRVHPTGGFLQALERLASMNYFAVPAEA